MRLFLGALLLAALLATASARDNESRTLCLVRALSAARLWIDPDAGSTIDRAVANGHVYSGGAPGLAFALAPAHLLLRPFLAGPPLVLALTLLGASLPFALSVVGVRRAVAASGRLDVAELAAVAHGFGTIALAFATRLYAHSLVVCLLAFSLALILERRRLALAGLLAAAAVVCDYNVGLAAFALLALVVAQEGTKGAVPFAIGAAGPAALLAAYHTACFGAPWRTPYDFHADPATRAIVAAGYGFSWPRPWIVLEVLFGLRRGFLFTQPIALAGLVGLGALAARRDRRALFALAVTLAVLLAHASRAVDWHAGASFGARYSAHALPFLALGYPRAFDLLGRARVPAVLASAALALVGAVTDWPGFDALTFWQRLWLMGPRTASLVVLLGLDDFGFVAALVSVLSLAVVVAAVVALVARPRPGWLLAAALAPVALGAHGVPFAFYRGPDRVKRELMETVARGQLLRMIDASRDLDEARGRLAVAELTGDPELVARARARVAALERSR